MKPVWALSMVAVTAALAVGCGYTTRSALDPDFQTIHVKPFQNRSQEYDFQAPLTNAVTRKFLHDGRLRVVGEDRADLVLEGAIVDYQLRGLTFDEDDNVSQFVLVVAAAARLIDPETEEVVWQDEQLTGETSYYTLATGQRSDRLRGNADVFLPSVRSFATEEENRAASEALDVLASRIFLQTIDPW
ncbi:MAG: LptE family protein [Candidatus Hydrogenedentota bacterium]